MNIKDRGNIKWTSLMLVEHRKKLEELKKSEKHRKRPDLDEQILELFDYRIKKAVKKDIKVKITYYNDHRYEDIITRIKSYDTQLKKLILIDEDLKSVVFKDVINISLLS